MPGPALFSRRRFVQASLGAAIATQGCDSAHGLSHITGSFTGINVERGHALRDGKAGAAYAVATVPSVLRRTRVLIAGGGVAGLAAARALRLRGVDDFALFELEDSTGGNSRGGSVQGIACPLGAHYLPVPGDDAHEVQDLLEELGLRRRVAGRWEYDERHLCHSPQERLFFNGQWQEGLLPVAGVGAGTLAQYQRFAALVDAVERRSRFAIPTLRVPFTAEHRALDGLTFAAWLDQQGLSDPQLRWYLDYCCRDDYGAGSATVSAWAGLHYFASRHGFHAPGGEVTRDSGSEPAERDGGVLTWPEGNAWLTRALAAPLGRGGAGAPEGHLHTGCTVLRITETRHGVEADVLRHATHALERWQAQRCIVALPVFIAARVVQNPPAFLVEAASRLRYAPWAVANIHLREPLQDHPGAAPAWDNVLYGSAETAGGLGYVDARHQALDPRPGPTVLTHYRALGDVPQGRRQLLEQPWQHWRDQTVAELALAHPDLADKATHIAITRYGHAMAMPVPGLLAALNAMPTTAGRLAFAHSDWAGYSIFEEAFTRGHLAGLLSGR